jgi:hypothetical protein
LAVAHLQGLSIQDIYSPERLGSADYAATFVNAPEREPFQHIAPHVMDANPLVECRKMTLHAMKNNYRIPLSMPI